MLLVVGSRSSLGRTVVNQLQGSGLRVRAGVRKPSSASGRGVTEVVRVDLAKPQTFATALAGVDTVFATAHALLDRRENASRLIDRDGHMALIDASKAAGVTRFVYTSALGAQADSPAPFWRYKAAVEAHHAASGLPYVALRPAAFMDFHAHKLIGAPLLAGQPAKILGSGRWRRNFVAVEDVAAVAVRALIGGDLLNRTVEIGGPDNLTEREVVDTYVRVAGVKPKIMSIPAALLPSLATLIGAFHAGAARVLRLPLQLRDRPELLFDAAGMNALLGRPPQSLEDFIRARMAKA